MAECACGERLFLGETKCPKCGAKGKGTYHGSNDANLPVDGANLLVRKGLSDVEIRQGTEDATAGYVRTAGLVSAVTGMGGGVFDPEGSFDDLAVIMKPERDAQGKVIWDWKNALVGAIVVAIVVGAVAFWIAYRLSAFGINVAPGR